MRVHFSSITSLISTRATEFPNHPIISVPNKDFQYTSYTYKDINDGGNRLAAHYVAEEGIKPRGKGDRETKLVTTLLAPSGIDYAIHEIALAKMGKLNGPLDWLISTTS